MAEFEIGHPEAVVRYVSQRQQRAKPKPKMQPPLTPMIDVTFQLLIFFLLATEFRQPEGNIPGTLPQAPSVANEMPEVPLNPVKITVRPTGAEGESASYEIEGLNLRIGTAKDLYDRLLERRRQQGGSKEIPVIIHPRYDVRWNFVVEAFNQAVRAEYETITFAYGGV